MTLALHTYTLHTAGDGCIVGRAWTNDNLDHGEPTEEASWDVKFRDRQHAVQSTGGTHIGVSGCRVSVTIDGVEVGPPNELGRESKAPRPRY